MLFEVNQAIDSQLVDPFRIVGGGWDFPGFPVHNPDAFWLGVLLQHRVHSQIHRDTFPTDFQLRLIGSLDFEGDFAFFEIEL